MSLSKANKSRPLTSGMWNFFTPDGNGQYATCNICKQKCSYKTTTSNLKRHILSRHPSISLTALGQTSVNRNITGSISPSDPDDPPVTSPPPSVSCSTSSQPSASLSKPSVSCSTSSQPSASLSKPSVSCSTSSQSSASLSKSFRQGTITSFVPKKLSATSTKKINEKLMRLFTRDYQPFKIVEDVAFTEFVAELNPSYQLPSRHTISKALIPAMYEESLIRTKDEVKNARKVCVTTDSWTSVNTESFNAVTAHFITDEFELKTVLLQCAEMPKAHTSVNLADDLLNIACEWSIEDKIILAVSDNATNITNAIVKHLNWEHFGCFAHSLNLILKKGLKIGTVEDLLGKIRTIVTHFKKSSTANEKLKSYQKNSGQQPLKLINDVSTRWNSTYAMLERFTKLEETIKATVALLDKNLPVLSHTEWKMAAELVQILKPFESITKTMSGEKYSTASLVIPLSHGLDNMCTTMLEMNLSSEVKNVVKTMKAEISNRFGSLEKNDTLLISTFIDPRLKNLAFCSQDASDSAKKQVVALVTEHLTQGNSNTMTPSTSLQGTQNELCATTPPTALQELSVWSVFDKTVALNQPTKGTPSSRAMLEVNRYLEEDILPRHEDPLKWWKDHKYNYPHLSTVVQERFCALGSSVPCERVFSKAGLLLSERRNRLSGNKANMLMFLNCNN